MSYIPELIITVGIPGCGKSTWVNQHKAYVKKLFLYKRLYTLGRPLCGAFVVCPDDIRKELTGDITDQSKNNEVWEIAKTRVRAWLNNKYDVILDATNVSTKGRRSFIEGLPECKLFAQCFPIAPEEAYARIKKDLDNGVDRSVVPEELVYRMY